MAKFVEGINTVTDIVARVASFGEMALPVAKLVAGILPGGGVVVSAIEVALPLIRKVSAAAPLVKAAVAAGAPIMDAIQNSGPDVLEAVKGIYAIAVDHDPERDETGAVAVKAAQKLSTAEVSAFAYPVLIGRAMTQEEENAWFDRFGIGGVA